MKNIKNYKVQPKNDIGLMKSFSSFLILGIILVLFIPLTVFSQNNVIKLNSDESATRLKSNSFEQTNLFYTFKTFNTFSVESRKGGFTELILPNGYSIGELGTPKLPAMKTLMEIPFGAEVEVNVISYTEEEYKLSDFNIDEKIIPMQPSLRKDQDIEKVEFFFNKEAYEENKFIQYDVASIEILGVLRGARIARLTVAPVSYNPAEDIVRILNNIELEINYIGADEKLTRYIKASTYSPYFDVAYSQLINSFATRDIFDDHPDLTKNPIKMLIVSHRDFETTLEPFIEWKTEQGFFLTVAYTDEIGTTAAAVRTWLQNKYNEGTPDDPAPTFVVIVGDADKIPASQVGSASHYVTDLYYATMDGDYFPEMYLGRLSARNTQELQNQIDKILYYQKYEFTDPTYLNDVTLIAGTDATWNPRVGEPTIKYGTANYFNTANGFSTVWGFGVENDPNNPNNNPGYTGYWDETRTSVAFINYTAHCNQTSWATAPNLTPAGIHSMTNTGKYPLAVGNCCMSSQFSHTESVGEAWVRAENKGAVAYIGSSPNTYWFEDFYWAVGAFPIQGTNNGYVPTVEETSIGVYDAAFNSDYYAVAAVKMVGNLAVTEANLEGYPSHISYNTLYYWEAYQTFGDPSTYIYYKEGLDNTVSHMAIVPIGLDSYTVIAEPGSYVGISKDGVLHGAALVDETGEVEVPIEPILEGGDVTIVVTKPQYIPYFANVPAAALEGPYITLDSFEVNDEDGNNNGVIDYGESFSIHVTIKNVGADNAIGITGTIAVDDPYFTLVGSNSASFGNVNSGDFGNTATVMNAFSFTVSNDVPNQYSGSFEISFTDGNDTWVSNLNLTANAPVLIFENMIIDDDGQGIPDVLDPGETADIIISIKNTGNSVTNNIDAWIDSDSPYITVNSTDAYQLSPLAPNASSTATFTITASPSTPLEETVVLDFTAITGEYQFEDSEETVVGLIPVYIMGESETVEACIGRFFDTGGPDGNYSNNENIVMTFLPNRPNALLEFEFLSFSVEAHSSCLYDWLKIYDGIDTSAPLIGEYCGTNSPGTFMASNDEGAITFHFSSDYSIVRPGWEALFSCFVTFDGEIGDVNYDGDINVLDVVLLLNYVLGNDPDGFYVEAADVNNDGVICIADVTALIDIILQTD